MASEDFQANDHGGPVTNQMTKSELRCYYRDTRNNFVLPLNARNKKEAAIGLESWLMPGVPMRGNIAGYAAHGSEIDPCEILKSLKKQGNTVALPCFDTRDSEMVFREYTGSLLRGPWGIMQPDTGNNEVVPDVVFVPLIAVDLRGNRLGQGQGHYDRALAKLRKGNTIVTTVGLAWECQIAETLPVDPWDQPVDYVCTPERLIETRK